MGCLWPEIWECLCDIGPQDFADNEAVSISILSGEFIEEKLLSIQWRHVFLRLYLGDSFFNFLDVRVVDFEGSQPCE